MYVLFMGPPDQDKEWSDSGVLGPARFLDRLWKAVLQIADASTGAPLPPAPPAAEGAALELLRLTHRSIQRVTEDIDRRLQFNTAIAAAMELLNGIEKVRAPLIADTTGQQVLRHAAGTLVCLVQPFAPHIAEELWERLGGERLWETPWPVADSALLTADTFTCVAQVNGKVRDRVELPCGLDQADVLARVRALPKIAEHIAGREIVKEIVVPDKLVNIVVR
jgi:leucyl-tRNA synthetase